MKDVAAGKIIYSCPMLFYSPANKKETRGLFFVLILSTQNRRWRFVKYFSQEEGL
jgi:hypothetical protein